jgi:hypothetical protein
MEILQKYATPGKPRYKIKVLLIEAAEKEGDAAKIIQKRIEKRHEQMVKNGFLRSVNPSIGNIIGMIQRNRAGYTAAEKKYTNKDEVPNLPYKPKDFHFEVIPNP